MFSGDYMRDRVYQVPVTRQEDMMERREAFQGIDAEMLTNALLRTATSVTCGGSLINAHWVLTAAHCCTPQVLQKKTRVTTGLHKLSIGRYIQTSNIVRMISHPNFKKNPWGSDICLVELDKPMKESNRTKYVRLVTPSIYKKFLDQKRCSKCLAMGFGRRNTVYEDGSFDPAPKAETMQCVFQNVMTDKYCKNSVAAIDTKTTLCTHGNPSVKADTCQGDSGGPLICHGFQIGLVAAGLGCGLGYPSYFTKIAPFHDFLAKYIPELRKKRTSGLINSVPTCMPSHIGYLVTVAVLQHTVLDRIKFNENYFYNT